MTETKLGTAWVAKGEGATAWQLFQASTDFDPNKSLSPKDHLFDVSNHNCSWDYKTNLALTGEPLTDEDLRRIAECE